MAGFGSEDKSSRFSYFSTAKRISDFSRLWVKTVRKAREIGHRTDKYIEVFYRDLKQTGVQTLKRLFHWCDIAVSEIEITEMLKEQSIHRLRVAESAGLADEYRRVGKDFFRNGEIEGWRSDLTRWQIALIEHLTADLMRELGYRRETVGPWGSSIGAAAALPGWVCAGLVWRLEEYASLLGPPWT
jgi:ribosomal protein L20